MNLEEMEKRLTELEKNVTDIDDKLKNVMYAMIIRNEVNKENKERVTFGSPKTIKCSEESISNILGGLRAK